jgi:hypothetical protein
MNGSWVAVAVLLCAPGCSDQSWQPFQEIEFRADKAVSVRETDGVLPGPDGLGGVPSGERISLTVSLAGPRGYHVEIVRTALPRTAATERGILEQIHQGESFVEKTTANGWELEYSQRLPPAAPGASSKTTRVHVRYREVSGKYFHCSWADVNCPDTTAAEAVCRSMRARQL